MLRKAVSYVRSALGAVLSQESLAAKTISSGAWAMAMNVVDRGLQIGLLIVLARLLDPSDFGLMGIALLTLSGLKMFSKLGIQDALIQNEDGDIDDYLDTAWSLQILRGIVIFALMYSTAPYVASFFGEPRSTDILRVIAVSPLLFGLRNPAIVYFQKELEFSKEFTYKISGSLMNFVVALAFALAYGSVWALVFGYLATDVTRLVASYGLHGYRPFPEFDRDLATDIIGYGKWITGSQMLFFLFSQGDDAVVGWALSATALGFYQLAYRLSNAPATEITSVISSVMFPTYSKLQDDTKRLRDTFFEVLKLITLVSFPIAAGIFTVAPTFVRTFLGSDWIPMITTMQILALWGLDRSIAAIPSPVWKAVGRPDYITKLGVLKVAVLAAVIYPATTMYGIEGTAFVLVATYLFPLWPIELHLTVTTIETSYQRYLRVVSYPFIASVGMGFAVASLRRWAALESGILEFVVLVVTGVVSYVFLVVVLETMFEWRLLQSFQDIKSSLSG